MTCSDAKVHKLIVDSRSRNFEDDPNDYRIDLPETFSNVKSIELKGAAVPRTEYNVNSSNKNIDFSVGTWISKITYVPTSGDSFGTAPSGVYNLTISAPVYTNGLGDTTASTSTDQTFSGVVSVLAVATVTTIGNTVSNVTITNSGLGYSNSSKITVRTTPGDYDTFGLRLSNFTVDVGFKYTASLREGQYNIGGNPQFTRDFTTPTPSGIAQAYPQSWVPNEFVRELESAMSFAMLDTANSTEYPLASSVATVGLPGSTDVIDISVASEPNIATNTMDEYCYNRRSWASTQWVASTSGDKDYPLLISSRIVTQYPSLRNQSSPAITRALPSEHETNSCIFNRLQFSNCLIIRADPAPNITPDVFITPFVFFDQNGWGYEVIKYFTGFQGTNGTVYFCKLRTPDSSVGVYPDTFWADYPWPGLPTNAFMYSSEGGFVAGGGPTAGVIYGLPGAISLTLETFELLFASEDSKFTNSSSLLGFNNIDYGTTWGKTNVVNRPVLTDTQYVFSSLNTGSNLYKVSIPRGLSYRTANDWYLHGDAEYVLISLDGLPSYNNTQITSDVNTNIHGEFACLVFDSPTSAVLQGMSSGPSITPWYAGKQTTNENMPSFINQSGTTVAGTNVLTGGIGTTNAFSSSVGGSMKGVSGSSLYGTQIVQFSNPVRNINSFKIRFTKFNKNSTGTTELYNFHGKDHLLIFEVVTQICKS
jgi:hypothetical protein